MIEQQNDTMVGRIPADIPDKPRLGIEREAALRISLTMLLLLSLLALVALFPGWLTFLLVGLALTSCVLLAKVVK